MVESTRAYQHEPITLATFEWPFYVRNRLGGLASVIFVRLFFLLFSVQAYAKDAIIACLVSPVKGQSGYSSNYLRNTLYSTFYPKGNPDARRIWNVGL